jgi:hypothetical protein
LKISTDNDRAPLVEVSVLATITGEVAATPDRLSVVIQKGETSPGSILSVEKVKGSGLSITKVESSLDFVTSEIQTLEPGTRYKIQLNTTPQVPFGRTDGTITVYTNDANDPKIEVPITVTVRGNLTIVPEQVSFGVINQGQPPQSKMITLVTSKDGLEIKKMESDSKFIKTKLEMKEAGKRFQIQVTVDQNVPVGPLQGKIVVRTNDPYQSKIEIPVTGRVQAVPKT